MSSTNDKRIKGSKIREQKKQEKQENVKKNTIIFSDNLVENKKEEAKKIGSRKIRKGSYDKEKEIGTDIKEKVFVQEQEVSRIKGKKVKKIKREDSEEKLDREIEQEDNLSVTVMILILVGCFVVGIFLGYMLYRIAINSSNAMFIISNLWG